MPCRTGRKRSKSKKSKRRGSSAYARWKAIARGRVSF